MVLYRTKKRGAIIISLNLTRGVRVQRVICMKTVLDGGKRRRDRIVAV